MTNSSAKTRRRRGRPRKTSPAASEQAAVTETVAPASKEAPGTAKRRGRPPKNTVAKPQPATGKRRGRPPKNTANPAATAKAKPAPKATAKPKATKSKATAASKPRVSIRPRPVTDKEPKATVNMAKDSGGTAEGRTERRGGGDDNMFLKKGQIRKISDLWNSRKAKNDGEDGEAEGGNRLFGFDADSLPNLFQGDSRYAVGAIAVMAVLILLSVMS